MRGLVERDRKLLGLLSQTAYAAILKTFQALFDQTDVLPGCVVSLQTFGAYGANFNPHAHALVSDGVFSAQGEFLPLPAPSPLPISPSFSLRFPLVLTNRNAYKAFMQVGNLSFVDELCV